MNTFFDTKFFANNRAKLQAAIGNDVPIVITANGVMQRGGDEPAVFYQDSNFWYLTGLNGADLTLVISTSETYVIVPSLSVVREAFDGVHNLEAYAARSGIDNFLPEQAGWKRLREQLRGAEQVATLGSLPAHLKAHGVYSLPFRRRLITKINRINPSLRLKDIRPQIAHLRAIKQPAELQALQQAIDITCDTLRDIAVPAQLVEARHEYELEAALTYGFRRRGAEGHGFAPIVGAGAHTTTLHYLENNGPIALDDLIVLDVGAGVEHYSADISRTISQKPLSGRKAEVFKAVEAVQDYALTLIKPGVLYRDYEIAVEAFMGEQLAGLGLISEPNHESIRSYYPHATSHFLGLDTHDAGDYRAPWQENMVITCEPGIYIPEENIGVRIEDDVLITKTGHKVLSVACPRRLSSVE